MNINQNHIGTGNYFWKTIAASLDAQYSHGSLTEFDFKSVTVFPLLHITLVRIDVDEAITTLSYQVMFGDQNISYSTDFQGKNLVDVFASAGYTEDNNYAFIIQELYVRLVKAIRSQEMAMYTNLNVVRPFTMNPFADSFDAVLSGFTLDINLTIINPIVTDGWC
jgi:hypothetical protein